MQHARPSPRLPFSKMHGAGNDFVVVRTAGEVPRVSGELARALADRHFGVGCDQVVEVLDSVRADVRLVFLNADGSASGACGNATRCIADREMTARGSDRIVLETDHGLLPAERAANGLTRVNMGQPVLHWQGIPLSETVDVLALPLNGAPLAVGMGNPHCVHFVGDADAVDLTRLGPAIEHHPLFPERTNVEVAHVRPDGVLRLRVWERGAGITLACGSGACATAVAAHRRGLTGREVLLDLDGGRLRVEWRDDGVWLEGPVAHVFDGEFVHDGLGLPA